MLIRPFAFALLAIAGALSAQTPPAGFTYQTLSDNAIAVGSSMAFLPDGRLLICQRTTGQIRVYANGALQAAAWATVPVLNSVTSEQGLLGIAVDPGFLTNHFVYVYYTTTDQLQNRIARLEEVGGVGANFTILSPANAIPTGGVSIHNGGRMVFGFDGKLYVGTGDRSVSTLAQQLTNWNGKILRFDVPTLTIPGDNPFAGSPIWSYGHRNQFGLTVHPVTGDIFQTENGLNTTDEINRIVRGGNYGWPTYEGNEPVPDPNTVDPLRTYSPTPDPVGTCFYSGTNYPAAYTNSWFFLEYTAGRVHKVDLNATATAVVTDVIWDDLIQAYDIQMGPDGNLWILHNDTSGARGGDELGRYVHSGEAVPSINLMAVSNKSVGGSLTFGFHGLNGDVFLGWAAAGGLPGPVTTPYGAQLVAVDIVLPIAIVATDDRAYLGLSIVNAPALIGSSVFTQAARFNPGTGLIDLTNADSIVLR